MISPRQRQRRDPMPNMTAPGSINFPFNLSIPDLLKIGRANLEVHKRIASFFKSHWMKL